MGDAGGHGYTVPARWLADLDAEYQMATSVNRNLGTWLGSKLPRIQRCWSYRPKRRTPNADSGASDPGEGQP